MTGRSIQQLVREDLEHREKLGIERYGQPVLAYNGRSAILDAYEEALDLCVYLRQVIEELTIDPQRAVQPDPVTPELERAVLAPDPPHWRAARGHAEDECGWYCLHDGKPTT